MNRYKGKAARWQQQEKKELRMNKTEFIKVRCTLEEKQRIKSKAESSLITVARCFLVEKLFLFLR